MSVCITVGMYYVTCLLLFLQLWCSVAEHGTHELEWPTIFQLVFSEYSTPEDETLGSQIVKVNDL